MAEAFARIYGKDEVEVYSAGSRPSGQINPRAVEAMKPIGYDLSRHRSKSLAELPDVEFDSVVTMGCGDECPNVRALAREDWDIPDPRKLTIEETRAARDVIEKKVVILLRKLALSGHRRFD